MQLETKRLILREMTKEDFAGLYEILSDAETMKHYPKPFDEEKVRGWIDWNQDNYRVFGLGLWAVTLKESGRLIGDCGLTMQTINGRIRPEIGYHIHKNEQGRGYASEAARACRDYIFKHTTFNTIYTYMKYTNVGSYTVALKNGMKLAEEYEDPVNTISKAYTITRQEWNNVSVDVSHTLLETERLLIRPWRADDAEDFYEYARVDGVGQMAGWMPHPSIEVSKEILESFIEKKNVFALELKSNHKVIGSLGLETIVIQLGEPYNRLRGREVGYVLSKDYWGQGLMPEAVSRLTEYCFENPDYEFLQCTHAFVNEQSKRVIEKTGFQFVQDDVRLGENGQPRQTKVYVLMRH